MARILSFFFLTTALCLASGCGVSEPQGSDIGPVDITTLDLNYGDGTSGPKDGNTFADNKDSPGTVSNEYPSAELLTKITYPTGLSSFATASGIVMVGGATFARPGSQVTMTYTVQSLDQGVILDQGTVTEVPFWKTGPIQLSVGDNLITVTAQADKEQASDSLIVTYNPLLPFDRPVQARPPALFVGEQQDVIFSVQMQVVGTLVGNTVTLIQVNEQGQQIGQLGVMKDDGGLNVSGDEIAGDGVYTVQVSLTCSDTQPIYVRAIATASNGLGQTYTAKSPITKIDCVQRLSATTCANHQKTLANARQAYFNALDQGSNDAAARQAAIAVLTQDPEAQQVANESEGGGLWVMWKDGVLGAINLAKGDTRGGGETETESPNDWATVTGALGQDIPVLSHETLLLSPFDSEFGPDNEAQLVAKAAANQKCPAYEVKGPYMGAAANLERFRQMSDSGIVVMATHGEVYFKGLAPEYKKRYGWKHMGYHEVLWTGEAVNCGQLTQSMHTCSVSSQCPPGSRCLPMKVQFDPISEKINVLGVCYDATQIDLLTGRVVLGDKTYGITPTFVLHYAGHHRFPRSLVYLGACRSLYNGSMVAALFASGALAVAAYTDVVSNDFAKATGGEFLARLIEEKKTAGQAYGIGAQDPDHPGAFFRLFGARSLTLSYAEILNPSFETGDLTAWQKDGDARVITQLGAAGPVAGKFMGIISTGLGYTIQTGSIEQEFCLPEGTNQLTFYWKYYSEEFREWCGTEFQDTFTATLTDSVGHELQLVNVSVDDLCAKSDCLGCGSQYVGLVPSDVQFDQGGAYKTDWQMATKDVSNFVGNGTGPVTLRFFCTDKGDSIYDTAVLLDHIKFE